MDNHRDYRDRFSRINLSIYRDKLSRCLSGKVIVAELSREDSKKVKNKKERTRASMGGGVVKLTLKASFEKGSV